MQHAPVIVPAALLAAAPAAAEEQFLLGEHVVSCSEGCKTFDRGDYPFGAFPTPEQDYPPVYDLRGLDPEVPWLQEQDLHPHLEYVVAEMRRLGYLAPATPRPKPAQ